MSGGTRGAVRTGPVDRAQRVHWAADGPRPKRVRSVMTPAGAALRAPRASVP